jgi:hypothetical protein
MKKFTTIDFNKNFIYEKTIFINDFGRIIQTKIKIMEKYKCSK